MSLAGTVWFFNSEFRTDQFWASNFDDKNNVEILFYELE